MPIRSSSSSPRRAGKAITSALLVIALLGVVAAWSHARASAAAARQMASPSVVALVDLERLINNLDQFKQMQSRIQPMVDQLQTELDTIVQDLQDLDSQYTITPETDNTQRTAIERDMRKLDAIAGQRKAINEQLISLRQGDELRMIYESVRASISTLAEREGYDLVIVDDRNIRVPERNADAGTVQNVISRKRVLFASNEVDITDRLISLMNQ
ncbi:MAG: OmpH family outer membrane protein [Planctomycetota bacterium]